ncbi:hypothetical protein B5807_01513 [Epicoccum nigrum]|uniref:Uncharacterized protein n=1 Tax=Epicoccum nigrum TaxID=105696 RepID=A0A1Y2MFK7_EPING|nr:hypothetical protein B5807_01513 [Epicoccum nigrum]
MALHRGRSSVQSENLTKKAKKGVDGNVQGKPTRVIFGGAPKRALTESPICKEPAFAKQLVPSKHELQNLRSNLSACIAAGNAHGAQRTPCKAPPPPSSLRFERVLGSRNPGVVSSKLTPCDSVYERVLEMICLSQSGNFSTPLLAMLLYNQRFCPIPVSRSNVSRIRMKAATT